MERELRAIVASLREWARRLRHQHVLWWTDSLCAYFALRNGTRKEVANALVKEIFSLCVRNGITLLVEWVPREWSQKADDLSKSEEEFGCGRCIRRRLRRCSA